MDMIIIIIQSIGAALAIPFMIKLIQSILGTNRNNIYKNEIENLQSKIDNLEKKIDDLKGND